jgi:TrmH family RNA methyltransferase
MNVPHLTSRDNPILKTIRLVSSEARSSPPDLVVAEGLRVLEEVVDTGYEIQAAVISENFGSAERERFLLDAWQTKGVRVYRTDIKLFRSISSFKTPQGALALVRAPSRRFNNAMTGIKPLVLCACGVQDPGNLGTLIRTAAAAGVSLVCTTTGTVSARNPKTIRSSAGAFFRINPVEHVSTSEFLIYCSRHSIQAYRTDIHQGTIYTEADLHSPCAFILGNESSGVAMDELAALPAIRIPMAKGVESLNVAVAGAIILYEAMRQRLQRNVDAPDE